MKFDYEFPLRDGSAIKFDRVEKLESWLRSELETWQWMNSVAPHGSNLYHTISSSIRTNLQLIDQLKSVPENRNASDNLRQNLNGLQGQISAGQFIPSRTDLGKFILNLSKETPDSAVDVFRVSMIPRNQNAPNDLGARIGVVLLAVYEHGLGAFSLQSSRRTVAELIGRLEQAGDSFDQSTEEKLQLLDNKISEREKKVTQSTRNLSKIFARHKRNLRNEQFDLRQEAKNKIDELEASTREQITGF